MEINQSNFSAWKKDEVTKAYFEALNKLRADVNTQLTNADVLLGDGSAQVVPRIIGFREGLDVSLEMTFEDIENLKEEENEEDHSQARDAGRAQSDSEIIQS